MKINILKSSIKRNPNAGRNSFVTSETREVTGYYIGKIPKKYNDKIHVVSQQFRLDGDIISEFVVYGKIPKSLQNDKNVKNLEFKMERQFGYTSTPEPEYLYKYENKHIKCSDCGKKTPFKKIEEDWINDEYHVYICPHCQSTEGYPDFSFQSITEALNECGEVLK